VSDDHLSLDELAEFDEGLLDPERTSAVRAHLHGCDRCRDHAQALATTRSILADLPAAAMPAEVSARLDQAIVDESAERAGAAPAGSRDSAAREAAHPADVVPAPGTVARRRLGHPTLPAIAVAAALVLAVGAIVVGAVNHNNGGSNESAGASSSVPGAPQGTAGGTSVISSDQPSNFVQTSTGQSYTAGTLTSDVQGLVAGAPATSTGNGAAAGSTLGTPSTPRHGAAQSDKKHRKAATLSPAASAPPSPTPNVLTNQPVAKPLLPLFNSRAKILRCAALITGTKNAVPIAIDFGTWTNSQTGVRTPAAVFVFKPAKPSELAVAFVTGPACDGTLDAYATVNQPG
jgi:hypothetical protein